MKKPDDASTILWMPVESASQFEKGFIERTRAARKAKFKTQKLMAQAMGISLRNYEKYETRSMLPHELIGQFTLIAEVSIAYLFGHDPRGGPPVIETPRRPSKAPRQKIDNTSENHL